MVGTGRFELPTPRTPSECSTRLSHVPTRKDLHDPNGRRVGLTLKFYTREGPIAFSAAFAAFLCVLCGPRFLGTEGYLRFLPFSFFLGGFCDFFAENHSSSSSTTANCSFFSTGSMRSSNTRIFCPML